MIPMTCAKILIHHSTYNSLSVCESWAARPPEFFGKPGEKKNHTDWCQYKKKVLLKQFYRWYIDKKQT